DLNQVHAKKEYGTPRISIPEYIPMARARDAYKACRAKAQLLEHKIVCIQAVDALDEKLRSLEVSLDFVPADPQKVRDRREQVTAQLDALVALVRKVYPR